MTATNSARRVIEVARDREIRFMAAAIAHYTLASLVPLLLFAVAMAALFGSEAAVESFVEDELADALSTEGQTLLIRALTSATGAAGAGVVSLLVTCWSASKVFRGFEVAFAELYDAESTPSLLEQLRDAAIVLLLLALAVAAMVATGIVVSTARLAVPYPTFVGTVLLLPALVVGLVPIYYVLTPTDRTVRDVLPGAVLAATGLVGLQLAFVVYARNAGRYEALGLLGAFLLFITWLYFGGMIVLLGGAVNYVTRSGTREPQ